MISKKYMCGTHLEQPEFSFPCLHKGLWKTAHQTKLPFPLVSAVAFVFLTSGHGSGFWIASQLSKKSFKQFNVDCFVQSEEGKRWFTCGYFSGQSFIMIHHSFCLCLLLLANSLFFFARTAWWGFNFPGFNTLSQQASSITITLSLWHWMLIIILDITVVLDSLVVKNASSRAALLDFTAIYVFAHGTK